VIGCRSVQKAILLALLEPSGLLNRFESEERLFERLALQEEIKNMPWNVVWDMFCLQNEVPVGVAYIPDIIRYEKEVTSKR
jgi:L-rhamnose isomerase